jgi:hypothetical protein
MNPIRAWNAFWFGPISARPLGAFRILFGLIILANLGLLLFDLDYWFTDLGIMRGGEAKELAGPLRFSVLFWIRDPLGVRIFFAVTAVIACLYTVGWHTRISGVAVYVAMVSIYHRNILTDSGADSLVTLITFYMMLSPAGAAYSLDARRAAKVRGTAAEPLIIPWAQRLIQLQVALIYFMTALFKANGTSWLNGTALHFVINNTEVGRSYLTWTSEYPLLLNLMTHGAIVIEFALAFLLWFRPTRRWLILAGLALHAGIALTVNIQIFGELITASYVVFLAPDELESVLRALNPKNWIAKSKTPFPPLRIPGRVDPPGTVPAPHRPVAVPTREHASSSETLS